MFHDIPDYSMSPTALQKLCDERALELVRAATLIDGKEGKHRVLYAIDKLRYSAKPSRTVVSVFIRLSEGLKRPPAKLEKQLEAWAKMEEVDRGMKALKKRVDAALQADGFLHRSDQE